ncbi:MAG: DNA repair protein RadA [Gammaproteobacteria bacterium]|nr:MAG: DNA repair protein RadA [Gammaproteobacteria bacterium]
MAKTKSVYVCNDCGASSPKWVGQCPSCNAWNSLTENVQAPSSPRRGVISIDGFASRTEIQVLDNIKPEDLTRYSTGLEELDRVLGGGMVPGSVVLLGGDPGIGKSTLLLQALTTMSAQTQTLYVTGEESAEQVAMRAHRLDLDSKSLQIMTENGLERILQGVQQHKPGIIVIDSIQTLYTELLQSAPGSVSQVRECAAQLVRFAKQSGTALYLVGHVTKEGALAGPRVLEHMVDTVLYFEGEASNSFRIVRAVKNRFGAVNEIGVFVMSETGLREVNNPSALFLSRQGDRVSGDVVLATQEGTRPLLVEVQALVDSSPHNNPRRVCVGLDQNRLAMLLAVLHRHADVSLSNYDVFINVVGGVRISETGSDLAVVAAMVSSLRDQPLGKDLVVFGEIGLGGEIRPVQRGQERLQEAAKLGFKRAMVAAANKPKQAIKGMDVIVIKRLDELFQLFQ